MLQERAGGVHASYYCAYYHCYYLSAGGRGGAAGGAAADHSLSLTHRLLLPHLGAAFGVGRHRIEEKYPGDQSVQNGGQDEGQNVKHREIREVNGQVVAPGHFVRAAEQHHVVVYKLLSVRQKEPHYAVGWGERPHQRDDPLRPG